MSEFWDYGLYVQQELIITALLTIVLEVPLFYLCGWLCMLIVLVASVVAYADIPSPRESAAAASRHAAEELEKKGFSIKDINVERNSQGEIVLKVQYDYPLGGTLNYKLFDGENGTLLQEGNKSTTSAEEYNGYGRFFRRSTPNHNRQLLELILQEQSITPGKHALRLESEYKIYADPYVRVRRPIRPFPPKDVLESQKQKENSQGTITSQLPKPKEGRTVSRTHTQRFTLFISASRCYLY